MRAQQKTLLGLGDESEKENGNIKKNDSNDVKSLSSVSSHLLQAPKEEVKLLEKPQTANEVQDIQKKVHFEIDLANTGYSTEIKEVNGNPLLLGIFNNGRVLPESHLKKNVRLAYLNSSEKNNELKIRGVEVYSPMGTDRTELKKMIIDKKQSKKGVVDRFVLSLDLENRLIDVEANEEGPRAFILRSGKLVSGGKNSFFSLKNDILDASNASSLQLGKGDSILVLTKKIQDALVQQTTRDTEMSSDYYNNTLANQIQNIMFKNKSKNGILNVRAVFDEISNIYGHYMKDTPETELVTSSIMVYQLG